MDKLTGTTEYPILSDLSQSPRKEKKESLTKKAKKQKNICIDELIISLDILEHKSQYIERYSHE